MINVLQRKLDEHPCHHHQPELEENQNGSIIPPPYSLRALHIRWHCQLPLSQPASLYPKRPQHHPVQWSHALLQGAQTVLEGPSSEDEGGWTQHRGNLRAMEPPRARAGIFRFRERRIGHGGVLGCGGVFENGKRGGFAGDCPAGTVHLFRVGVWGVPQLAVEGQGC